jgi:hypothetical protein
MAEYKQPEEVALPKPVQYPSRRRGKIFGTMMANINKGPNKLSGYPDTDVKRDGVETRGNGAATKGTKARGPMA